MKNIEKLDWKFFAVIFAIMCVIYIVTRYCLGNMYTPEWTARQIFPYLTGGLTFLSLKGYRKMVSISVAGYIAGIAAGEIFGGFESHIGPQYNHWGWLISIAVFALSVVAGYFVEKSSEKNK